MSDLDLPLGRTTPFPAHFAPELLRAIPRQAHGALLQGADHWTAHEHTWLDARGRPACGVLDMRIPLDSPAFVESKSLKLYLGSFAMTRWPDAAAIAARVAADVGEICGAAVAVRVHALDDHAALPRARDAALGACIDLEDIGEGDVAWSSETPLPVASGPEVAEVLFTHLLRSLCPVTGQPDQATLVIDHVGPAIDRASLLRYVVGFRNEACFHEQLVERIHSELLQACRSRRLTVMGLFCRRGGIDIVPVRSTESWQGWPPRAARQ